MTSPSPEVLGVVTARGGSKGLPRKNVLPLAGKPLIQWTLEAAAAATSLTRTIVSTDDPEIREVARAAGGDVPFLRPAELADDGATSVDVLLHALDAVGGDFGVVVLLQPTSPLRTAADIDAAVARCAAGAPSCVSVTPSAKNPFWMYHLAEDDRMVPVVRREQAVLQRQALPPVHVLNGAVYAVAVPWLRARRALLGEETVGIVMPPERSVDIDTAFDLELAAFLASRLPA